MLHDLRPVGGPGASFNGAINLIAAIERLLTDNARRNEFLSLTLFVAEGLATLIYEQDQVRRHASFVSNMAVSLLQSGAESAFDANLSHADVEKCSV
jgi:hypothetical protein